MGKRESERERERERGSEKARLISHFQLTPGFVADVLIHQTKSVPGNLSVFATRRRYFIFLGLSFNLL